MLFLLNDQMKYIYISFFLILLALFVEINQNFVIILAESPSSSTIRASSTFG